MCPGWRGAVLLASTDQLRPRVAVGQSAEIRGGTQRILCHVSPWGCALSLLAPGSYEGLGFVASLRLSPPAVRTTVTTRYETIYRSTTAQEEAALEAATARGTERRDRGGWRSSVGQQALLSEAG